MVRTSQGGSVLGFVVVGVVLTALLMGGVYFVRQNTTLAANPVAQPEEVQQEDTAREEPKPSTENESPKEVEKPNQQSEKAEQKPDTQTEKPQEAEKPSQHDNATDHNEVAKQKELPKTGPVDALMSLIGAGTLVGVAAAYFQSRRLRASL